MTVDGIYGGRVTVEAGRTNHGAPCIYLAVHKPDGSPSVSIDIDENHAAALAKAIESGVMVLQARAVGR